MRVARRVTLGGLLALVCGTLPWRHRIAAAAQPADPIRLVEGWLLRQSDLDALAAINDRQPHDT